jgi:transcriptional regulator with XRE-family HTH domain
MSEIGEVLKIVRKHEKVSQEKLAERVGKSVSWVKGIESGFIGLSAENLIDLADSLKAPILKGVFMDSLAEKLKRNGNGFKLRKVGVNPFDMIGKSAKEFGEFINELSKDLRNDGMLDDEEKERIKKEGWELAHLLMRFLEGL